MKTLQLMMLAIAVTLAGTQAQPDPSSFGRNALIGAWHLVRIEAPGSDGPQPKGMLIDTRDGHMSVQLMFPKSANASDDEYVLGGYEASFGSYDVDEASTSSHTTCRVPSRGISSWARTSPVLTNSPQTDI